MSKKPNHLAALIDHQSAAKSALPNTLANTLKRLTQATDDIKKILVDCLPEEIVKTCQVVGLTEDQLTLSVHSQTAANHIRYLQSDYVRLLREQSIQFSQIREIRIIVTPTKTEPLIKPNSASSHNVKGLSETTRQTIAHAAKHVIKDEALQKSLLRLAKED
ncbi:DciA family protein [Psychrobacter pygoscelis]|uniref:DciA family protein n=1 Tax=Psychrobacter pygoscelis TaxID=2488563 RepID=UPI00103B6C63|nr:DciA family protein [Psychrobacter pygoscelis]